MNNTHYALINENGQVVAVVKTEDFKGRVIKAVEDETGDEVLRIEIKQFEHNNYRVEVELVSEGKYTAFLRPTWEY
jgi:Mg2+/Co2+ transporter CorC